MDSRFEAPLLEELYQDIVLGSHILSGIQVRMDVPYLCLRIGKPKVHSIDQKQWHHSLHQQISTGFQNWFYDLLCHHGHHAILKNLRF